MVCKLEFCRSFPTSDSAVGVCAKFSKGSRPVGAPARSCIVIHLRNACPSAFLLRMDTKLADLKLRPSLLRELNQTGYEEVGVCKISRLSSALGGQERALPGRSTR